ncbi:MAG TPA: CNNM domain-containing protein [Candidatus Saccharimonadales bacterium]|nr:CNNM domain-containing protein [Candidatus Saccharimonadales bacterium]
MIPSAAILPLETLFFVALSATCSGLNIALMSLEVSDLRRKAKLGNHDAQKALPLRNNVHLTLAAILFTNVAAVSATSLFLESKLNGLLAGVIGTLLIVVFGEILPQAFFSSRALRFFAFFVPMLRVMIFLTYPVAKPLQLLLDRLFGKERVKLQTRRELGLLISEHLGHVESELDEDEVEIVRGALQLSEKRVRDITTPIRSVYWLTPDTEINAQTIDEIKTRGWSRMPVFNQQRSTCYGILLMKDLVDIDFDETPVLVQDFTLHPAQVVGSMTALDTLFRKFITGGSHLIPVEKDDHIIGIVTIEDLLEEIVGHEIEDETDRTKRITSGKKLIRSKKK